VLQFVGVKEKEGKQEESIEATKTLSVNSNYNDREASGAELCALESCATSGGTPHNIVRLQQTATGSGEHFSDTMWSADVEIAQEKGPEEPTFNTTSPEIAGRENVMDPENILHGKHLGWLSANSGTFETRDKDPGIGISLFEIRMLEQGYGYEHQVLLHQFFEEGKCSGIQCFPEIHEIMTYNTKMPNGENTVGVTAKDLASYGATNWGDKIKVDDTPPYDLALTGLPSNGVISEAQYHLQARATDGTAPITSSGVKRLEIGVEGYAIPGGKVGTCTPGPCTATGEWTINGETFGAGKHTLTVVAEDYAGNVEKKEYTFTVRHAGAMSVGPGSVDPITGALHLSASDVSIGGGFGSLGLSRSYDSRQLTAGAQGSLGPQWKLSISGSQEIEQEPTGSVTLVSASGGRTTFEPNGKGGFISPKGDESLVLEAEKEGEKVKRYLLKDPAQGTTVKYTQLGSEGPWVIESSEDALSKTNGEKQVIEWERLEGVTRPKLALAPAPTGVTCAPTVKNPEELAVGCRALSFTYATETTATGEAPSEWKAYKGRLEKVAFTAANKYKSMETRTVAEYSYDKQGRLRAEWDPRISPALKTTYGYDAEGHVVAVNPPGQEPALLHYGTTASDPSAGRLLSVTRPPAGTSSQLKEQNAKAMPTNESPPTLSTTSPAIGATLSISSNGTWSNSPLAYSDAWEDCYTRESKETCTAIPGAVNSTYTPQARDAGYTLRAQVTGVNADGTTSAETTATSAVGGVAPAYLRKFGEKGTSEKGQFNAPVATAIDHTGNVWAVDHNNNRIEEWSATGTWLHTYGKKGTGELQFESPEGIAVNTSESSPSFGDVYIADKGNNRIEELNAEGKYVRSFGVKGKAPGQLSEPEGVAVVPAGTLTASSSGEVWVGDSGNDRVDEFSETGEYIGSFGSEGSGEGQFKAPDGIAFSGEYAYVVDSGNDRVQKFSLSGAYIAQFGSKGTSNGQFETPYGIATESVSGDLYVADQANNRLQEFSPAGTFIVAYGKKGEGSGEFSSPAGMAVNAAGDVYVADTGNNRVQELEPKYSTNNPLPEPPALGTSDVSTIDYNVPLWGEGAPDTTAKTAAEKKTELEKWGQTDDPAEPVPGEPLATAVFPPDEPMGWPAKDYKRAAITYMDELGRTVNRAYPSGGIATSEYNEYNDVIRSLGADNRAAALKEGAKSREASELLDTKSKYNGETKEEKEEEEKYGPEGAPGTRLLETIGPQHTIRLAGTTTEKQARNHVEYTYGSHSVGGEQIYLVTDSRDWAEYEGKEAESRRTSTSYSGQESLGWLLRKPTSVTTHFKNGGTLTHGTIYELSTGNVIETRAPASEGSSTSGTRDDIKQWGSVGKGNSQFESPKGVAVASNGDIYVADGGNSRIQEFSPTGAYITQWGSNGAGNGQFEGPKGVAVASNGHVYVVDSGNSRVEEFSATGEYITKWGSEGAGNGQFEDPEGIAVAPDGDVYVTDGENQRVQEFSATGEYITKWGSVGTGNSQFENPKGVAVASDGDVYVVDSGNARVEEFSPTGEYITQWGTRGTGNGQFKEPYGIAVTGADVYVLDKGNSRVEEFSASGTYLSKFGTEGTGNGELKAPTYIAVTGGGNVLVADSGNERLEEWGPGKTDAHDSQAIYYSAAANTTAPACGLHPEWANLPCQSQPAVQAPNSLPELPVVTDTYNMWDEPETVSEKFESTTRTKKLTYDNAGRVLTNEETASPATDTALPKVTDKYNSETGEMTEQSTTSGETTKTIKSVYNTLGQLTEYTDATGNTTQYTYSGPANDNQVEEVNYGDKKGSQIYSYSPTSMQLEKLLDLGPEGGAGAGTFTASYDVEGRMTSETYPNGMAAKYTYNPAGEATGIEYEKTTHCTEHCVWFSETVAPAIHGETLARTSTLAKEEYTYDEAGRLTQVNETPAGKGCKTRIYAYNEESERTSETTRESATETCATSGGTEEKHTYDTAAHLTDTGVEYEIFGNETKIPAADAGEHEIAASFYTDNQVASQKQNGETTNYIYDPAGRTETTVSEGTTKASVVDHYAGPGEAVSWTSEEEGKKWTRNIPGIDGTLTAVEMNGEPAVLQLQDLVGDIVATAAKSETETKLLSTYNSTEFGVQINGTPPTKYSWLGASGLSTEPASAATASGGSSYVPQLGMPLQTQPIGSPGAFPNGSYTGGLYVTTLEPWVNQSIGAWGAGGTGREASRQEAARIEAAKKIAEATCTLASCTTVNGPGEGNCESNCEVEGGEGGGEVVLGTITFEPEGTGAHAADWIGCEVGERNGLPHASGHNPGSVNWVVFLRCTGIVLNVEMRLALFWEGEESSETGYVYKGDTASARQNVTATCLSGWYTGWVSVHFTAPPGYRGQTKFQGWSKASRYVKC
jgi:hypothetical protein